MKTVDYTQYVDIYIGTISHLLQATSPAVQSPHGMVIARPVFRPGMTDVYNSDKIFGFTAGSVTLMPVLSDKKPDFFADASVFDHDFETAHPDCHEIFLEDINVNERHTAMKNTGAYEFVFGDNAEKYSVAVSCGSCTDYKTKNGKLYFAVPVGEGGKAMIYTVLDIKNAEIKDYSDNKNTVLVLSYDNDKIYLPFAVCATALADLDTSFEKDVNGKSFDDIRSECKAAWNAVLGKVRVTGGDERMKRVFYTALYRSVCRMQDYSVNGKYYGFDGKVHDCEGHGYYINDGIWDTYRGMHPLQLLLEPEVHRDCLISYLRMYEQSGWLPRFPYLNGNAPCMIGHHTVSLFAEAMKKGIDCDYSLAYEAAHKNATHRTMLPWTDGEADELTEFFYKNGYFPALDEDEKETCSRVHGFENRQSVAVTIEHSYDDRCVAMLAEKLGKTDEAAYFRARSMNYKKLYNKETGFFSPRKEDGSFTKDFDPKFCGGWGGRKYFAENNAYIYNFAAQHDINGLIELFGGREAFAEKLDNLFTETYDGQIKCEFLAQYPDATGLMGQFCMGNEPSFHIPYLYNYCGQAYKTQRKIHELIKLWFTDSPLGICGDEDGGAMSAFLVFSAMGFYPVDPASGSYDIGSPVFDRIELDLPNGKTFTVNADGASGRKKYIRCVVLGGETLSVPKFSHEQLMCGGELTLTMDERPDKELFQDVNRI